LANQLHGGPLNAFWIDTVDFRPCDPQVITIPVSSSMGVLAQWRMT